MSVPTHYPTPYPDVNAVLNRLLSDARAILGDRLVALWLYGSLASGDFNPQSSDIDFVVVTAGDLSEDLISGLEAMHTRLWASELTWAARLEGAYIPQAALRRYDPAAAPCPAVNEGRFYITGHGSDWIIQRYILREYGVVVAGPPPQPLIDPVSPDDLRQAVAGIIREWWVPMLDTPAWLRSGEYQAYAILSMCRALYTLEHGTIPSKPAAARWAQATLGERWTQPIEQALACQHGSQIDLLADALALIRYTVEQL